MKLARLVVVILALGVATLLTPYMALSDSRPAGIHFEFSLHNDDSFDLRVVQIYPKEMNLQNVIDLIRDDRLMAALSSSVDQIKRINHPDGSFLMDTKVKKDFSLFGVHVPLTANIVALCYETNAIKKDKSEQWTRACRMDIHRGDTGRLFSSGKGELVCSSITENLQVKCESRFQAKTQGVFTLSPQQIALDGARSSLRDFGVLMQYAKSKTTLTQAKQLFEHSTLDRAIKRFNETVVNLLTNDKLETSTKGFSYEGGDL